MRRFISGQMNALTFQEFLLPGDLANGGTGAEVLSSREASSRFQRSDLDWLAGRCLVSGNPPSGYSLVSPGRREVGISEEEYAAPVVLDLEWQSGRAGGTFW